MGMLSLPRARSGLFTIADMCGGTSTSVSREECKSSLLTPAQGATYILARPEGGSILLR